MGDRCRGRMGTPDFLDPWLGLLEETLFPLEQLLLSFEPVLFPLQHWLFPFEPELSGFKAMLSGLQPRRDSFKGMRPGMKPEAFPLQPHSRGIEPIQLRLQSGEHLLLPPPSPKEPRRCPTPGIVPQRSQSAIRVATHSMPEKVGMESSDEPVA